MSFSSALLFTTEKVILPMQSHIQNCRLTCNISYLMHIWCRIFWGHDLHTWQFCRWDALCFAAQQHCQNNIEAESACALSVCTFTNKQIVLKYWNTLCWILYHTLKGSFPHGLWMNERKLIILSSQIGLLRKKCSASEQSFAIQLTNSWETWISYCHETFIVLFP